MAEMIPFEEKKKDGGESSEDLGEKGSREAKNAARPIYTNEEVSEIIRVALRNVESDGDNTVGHEEMLSIARDFGLTERDLQGAFETISRTRDEQERTSKVALALKVHAMCFAVVLVALFSINWITMPSLWWSVWPFIGWGTILVLHGILTRYLPSFTATLVDSLSGVSVDWIESNTGSDSIPAAAAFATPDLYGSLARATGVALIQADDLLLEFETKDTVFGIIRSGVKELRVPLRDIASVRLTRVIWSTKLTLQSHRLKTFEDFPGHKGGKILLVFDRQARAASERLAAELSKGIAQP